MNVLDADFVVIGSGLAGSVAAYLLSGQGTVLLLSKAPPTESNSFAAQGGIAAAIGVDDSVKLHAKDTLEAGDGLCDAAVVRYLTELAPELVRWLLDLGVPFDKPSDGQLSLGLEGAHSRHRILHAGGDATGRLVMETVTAALEQSPTVKRVTNVHVNSLIQNQQQVVVGALGHLLGEPDAQIQFFGTRAVILATGGAGQLFSRSTNPRGATGDGIALAYQVGARVRNLEFVQFHPTTLHLDGYPPFLVSEAVRGAGGMLVNHQGEAIMASYAKRDLEPRDVVARVIYNHMLRGERVYLDCRNIEGFAQKFPTIYVRCKSYGVHAPEHFIPVSPAAHFMMGGIVAEMNGKTDIPGLYAIGEVASTGVHGANRLASNSLLECLVMAFSLMKAMKRSTASGAIPNVSRDLTWSTPFVSDAPEVLRQIQSIMWQSAGIVRQEEGLQTGLQAIQQLKKRYPHSPAVCIATLILQSASLRRESRGAHYRLDFPTASHALNHVDTVLSITEDYPVVSLK